MLGGKRCGECFFKLIGVGVHIGNQHEELITANTEAKAMGAERLIDMFADKPKAGIARNVSVNIVDLLEIIDVEKQDFGRGVKTGCRGLKARTVEQASEGVRLLNNRAVEVI